MVHMEDSIPDLYLVAGAFRQIQGKKQKQPGDDKMKGHWFFYYNNTDSTEKDEVQ